MMLSSCSNSERIRHRLHVIRELRALAREAKGLGLVADHVLLRAAADDRMRTLRYQVAAARRFPELSGICA